jgi:uncharacterized protein
MKRAGLAGGCLAAVLSFLSPCAHGQILVNGLATGSNTASIHVQSFEDRKFITTIRQEYDFSCGSAALATLLTYTYHIPSTESTVFSSMYLNGDRQVIQQSGFSLLDMKEYLARNGVPSGGFRAPLDKLVSVGIPAIVLINEHGYKHFVVLRGVYDGRVLLSDPAIGLRTVSVSQFNRQWSGIFFIILADIPTARAGFNDGKDWSGEPGAPIDLSRFMVNLATLEQVSVPDAQRF